MYPNLNEIFEIIGFAFILSVIFLPLSMLLGDYTDKLDHSYSDNRLFPIYQYIIQSLLYCCMAFLYFNPVTYIIFGFVFWFDRRKEKNEKIYAEEEARKEREYQERLKIEEDYLRDYYD